MSIINVNDEYGTPKEIIDEACHKYKLNPKLDVATSEAFWQFAPERFDRYFIQEQNALTKEWDQDFFMNPPYSKIAKFVRYAYEQHIKHNVDALILTYAKVDTKWWHELVEGKAEVHNIQGRINFNDMHGKPRMIWSQKYKKWIKGNSPYPSCWIIFRSSKK